MQSPLYIALEHWPELTHQTDTAAPKGNTRNPDHSVDCWVRNTVGDWEKSDLDSLTQSHLFKPQIGADTEPAATSSSAHPILVKVLILSPELISTHIRIPKSQQRHLHKILPFVCEEKVASDIDQMHLVAGSIQGEKVAVRLIEKRRLSDLLALMQQYKLTAESVICASDLCTPQRLFPEMADTHGGLACLNDDQLTFINSEDAINTLSDNASVLVDGWYKNQDHANATENKLTDESKTNSNTSTASASLPTLTVLTLTKSATITQSDDSNSNNPDTRLQLTLDAWRSQGAVITHQQQASNYPPLLTLLTQPSLQKQKVFDEAVNQGINLLTGRYKPKSVGQKSGSWGMVGKVAAAVFALNIVYLLGSGIYWQQQTLRLEQDTEALYRELFPNDQRIVNIKRQTENHLRRLSQTDQRGLIVLMNQFLPAWGQQSQLTLKSLRYQQLRNELILDVEAPSISDLDALQQAMGNQAELLSANEDGSNRARGRLKFRGAN